MKLNDEDNSIRDFLCRQIRTVEWKLESLTYCLKEKAHEDAAGHLCDLLEFCRQRIITDSGMMFANLGAMVVAYGSRPEPIEGGRR